MVSYDRSPGWFRDAKWLSGLLLVLALAAATLFFSLAQLTARTRALPLIESVLQLTLLPEGLDGPAVTVRQGIDYQPGEPLQLLPGVEVYADATEIPTFSIDAAPNGDVIVAGMNREPDREDLDVLVARINGTGDVVWQQSYGGGRNDIGHGVLALAEGGFLVTGYGESHSAGGADMYAIRLDDDGDVVWWRNHGGPLSERAMMSERLSEGTFVATGYAQIAGEREWDAALWAFGPDGNLIDSTKLTNTGYDRGVMVRALRRGGLVITGSFGDPRSPSFEAFLVRRSAR